MKNLAQSPHQLPENNLASSHESPRQSIPPVIPLEDNATDNMSKLSLTDDEAVYIGSSHWITILEDVSNLLRQISKKFNDDIIRSDFSKMSCLTIIPRGPKQESRRRLMLA